MVRTFDYHCYISPLFCCTLHTSANAAFFTTCNWILCVWLNDFELCSGATERSLTHFLCCALIHESHGPYCMSSAWLSATFFFFSQNGGRPNCCMCACVPMCDILLWHLGDWETKVSNREKRQQKRKEKGTGDGSPSPGGVEPPANPSPAPEPVKPTNQKKSKGEGAA